MIPQIIKLIMRINNLSNLQVILHLITIQTNKFKDLLKKEELIKEDFLKMTSFPHLQIQLLTLHQMMKKQVRTAKMRKMMISS